MHPRHAYRKPRKCGISARTPRNYILRNSVTSFSTRDLYIVVPINTIMIMAGAGTINFGFLLFVACNDSFETTHSSHLLLGNTSVIQQSVSQDEHIAPAAISRLL